MYQKLLAGLLAVLLVGCGEDSSSSAPAPATPSETQASTTPVVQANNPDWPTYVVGTEATYQPFEFKNEIGQAVGFEIDLLNAIAQNQQFNVQIISDLRKNAEEALNKGTHRIWVSAFQIGVDIDASYSDSIMSFYRVVGVPEDSPIKTLNDLKGKRIAVNEFSSQDTLDKATQLVGETGQLNKQPTFVLATQAIWTKTADAVIGDVNMLRYYDTQHPEVKLRFIEFNDPVGEIGFAVQKNDREMQEKLNAGLKAIKADGTYDKILKKWFGEK